MKIAWVILAEGLGVDSKGAVTVIGVNQNLFITPVLPAMTKRAILIHLVDDDGTLQPGDIVDFSVRLESPSGKVVAAVPGRFGVGSRPFEDLPGSMDLPAEMAINVTEYGHYRFAVEVTGPRDLQLEAEVELFAHEPPA